ncbi:MAG: transposase family protein [Thioploca sp.]|nr:transposase family protein [Thioploca sp.]
MTMNPFDKYKQPNRDNFVHTVGLSLEKFQYLVEPTRAVLQVPKDHNPLKKRGLKSELSLENQVLLTLLYLRDYPTFIQLRLQFGISESYAHKIYHKMSAMWVKILI